MKKRGSVIVLIILIIVLIALGVIYIITNSSNNDENTNNTSNSITENNEEQKEEFKLDKENYPKVDGATAMRPMSVEIAKSVLNMTNDEAESFIVHNTTAKAYENLINKKVDLIFVSEPSDDILNQLKKLE